MVELTPACDFAQGKARMVRLVGGLLVPEAVMNRVKKSAGFLWQSPLLELSGKGRQANCAECTFCRRASIDRSVRESGFSTETTSSHRHPSVVRWPRGEAWLHERPGAVVGRCEMVALRVAPKSCALSEEWSCVGRSLHEGGGTSGTY
jgi:hypothetical protein